MCRESCFVKSERLQHDVDVYSERNARYWKQNVAVCELVQSSRSDYLLTNLRNGFSCREDDGARALGAELLRKAGGVRKQRAAGRRGDEGDTGTP